MPPVRFSVSQVCVAAACPRILYSSTPLAPKRTSAARADGDPPVAAGRRYCRGRIAYSTPPPTPFTAESTRRLFAAPELAALLAPTADRDALAAALLKTVYWECVDRDALAAKDGEQQRAFMDVLRNYTAELADVLASALGSGRPAAVVLDELFADTRRRGGRDRFPVGPAGEPVHVTGVLDYVFHDWRSGRDRILDYKLLPPAAADKFQVGIYALMHHVQHATEPSAGASTTCTRGANFTNLSWDEVRGSRATVFNLLASMREWVGYDEATGNGLKPPGSPDVCPQCRWRHECSRKRLRPGARGRTLGPLDRRGRGPGAARSSPAHRRRGRPDPRGRTGARAVAPAEPTPARPGHGAADRAPHAPGGSRGSREWEDVAREGGRRRGGTRRDRGAGDRPAGGSGAVPPAGRPGAAVGSRGRAGRTVPAGRGGAASSRPERITGCGSA